MRTEEEDKKEKKQTKSDKQASKIHRHEESKYKYLFEQAAIDRHMDIYEYIEIDRYI